MHLEQTSWVFFGTAIQSQIPINDFQARLLTHRRGTPILYGLIISKTQFRLLKGSNVFYLGPDYEANLKSLILFDNDYDS